jgi:hypothetical protein
MLIRRESIQPLATFVYYEVFREKSRIPVKGLRLLKLYIRQKAVTINVSQLF